MLLLVDNYDSFVMNIIHYLEIPRNEFTIVRNDEISIDDINSNEFDKIIISPGPMSPAQAGVSNSIIKELTGVIPILGICLGFECIGEAFGGELSKCPEVIHGQADCVHLEKSELFDGLPPKISAARYHSLYLSDNTNLSSDIIVNARLENGMIMGIQHRSAPLYGLLFHPESVLTGTFGKKILHNFISISDKWNDKHNNPI